MVQVFITGGTFDKNYNYIDGNLFFKDSHVQEMLIKGRSTVEVDIKTLMMLDSLEMTHIQRDIIIKKCKDSSSDQILITHGTDTMVETAKAIALENIPNKTIVLTGAMIPYAFGNSSDGFFNLGSALAFSQTLPPGVYVAMNGRFYNWDNVKKNRKTGFFEETNK